MVSFSSLVMGCGFITRAQRVGGLSLSSLLVAGTIFILFFINASTTYRHPTNPTLGYDSTKVVFRLGADLGVQKWLAMLGVAFGLLSHGLLGTYTHMFDLWCSFRCTRRSLGLDYARYLNSQPYAPVMFGFRGFLCFILLRYLVLALGLVATVCYPFAIIEVTLLSNQGMQESMVKLRVPAMKAVLQNGTTSPWLGDSPNSSINRAFLHQYQNDVQQDDHFTTPISIVMVGWADCGDTFDVRDQGMLYTREIVMAADLKVITPEEQPRDTHMSLNHTGWLRGQSTSSKWADGKGSSTSQGVIIDYRILDPGSVEIQWAETGDWANNSSLQQPIIQRLEYSIHFAVAVVQRRVSGGECSTISDEDGRLSNIRLITNISAPVATKRYDEPLHLYRNWIDATLLDSQAGPREGVSSLLRSVMAEWGTQLQNNVDGNNNTDASGTDTFDIRLGHAPLRPPKRPPDLPPSVLWLNETAYNASSIPFVSITGFLWNSTKFSTAPIDVGTKRNIKDQYPVYSGTRATRKAGSYYSVTYLFLCLGIFAYLIIFLRIFVGPPVLTSWMGQHIYLAMAGKTPVPAPRKEKGVSDSSSEDDDNEKDSASIERLACGYQPARDLGPMKIEPGPRPLRFPITDILGINWPSLMGAD